MTSRKNSPLGQVQALFRWTAGVLARLGVLAAYVGPWPVLPAMGAADQSAPSAGGDSGGRPLTPDERRTWAQLCQQLGT